MRERKRLSLVVHIYVYVTVFSYSCFLGEEEKGVTKVNFKVLF